MEFVLGLILGALGGGTFSFIVAALLLNAKD